MTSDHFRTMGVEFRKDTQSIEPKMLFFAMILTMSHFIRIEPSELDTVGVKIKLTNMSVIHGGIAAIFLYYFFNWVNSVIVAGSIFKFDQNKIILKSIIRNYKSPKLYKDTKKRYFLKPREVKKYARITIIAYYLFCLPFATVVVALIMSSLILGTLDSFRFINYICVKLFEN